MRPDQEFTLEVRTTAVAAAAPILLVPFVLIAALVAGSYQPLHDFDRRVTDRMHEVAVGHPGWADAMAWWSLIFHPTTWRIAAALLMVWLWRRHARPLAIWVGATMAAGALLGVLLKLLFGRHRPDLLDPVAQAAGYAFPSGHALTNALGAAVFLMVLLPLVRDRLLARAGLWFAALVIPLVTAFTRVALGVHWASDVVAGLLFGVALAALTAWAFVYRVRPRRVRESVPG
ncbi:phosphatase PAP2 family protein [Actinoplanes aureus]|uniref:Phosphatase PAP2 family protein n=1 Tax=Actinoplanes aureus TaxID=2792083 RepID=A0A931C4L7_9ACTN|nr:phosphatase PAP2 family protein [Actinoplanes aureus]MBG0562129.1 phosphatase PAP2 family protein [Actinoplanes aureus]